MVPFSDEISFHKQILPEIIIKRNLNNSYKFFKAIVS